MPSVYRDCSIYVRPMLSKSNRESLPFWLQPDSVVGCSLSNDTSTKVHLRSPYHSILAPDRMTLAVPIPLTIPLIRVHCPRRFIPHPCRMAGRILEVELQVALKEIPPLLQHIFMRLHVATNTQLSRRSLLRSD